MYPLPQRLSYKALEAPFRLNSAKCLSYLTIEYRGELPPDTGQKMGKMIYGCDECQRACPWNRFATPSRTIEFSPSASLLTMREGRLAPPLGRTIQDTVQGQRSEKGQVSGTHAKHPVREKVSDRSSENTPHGLNKQNLATILFSRLIIFS